jgi:predicted alpha/beta hydrolase
MSQRGLTVDTGLRIPARDGFKLAATLYHSERGDGPAVLINSATAVKRRYYDPFARYLAERGFSVLTYDYRGIGGSRPKSLRGFKARLHQWGEEDMAGAVDWVSRHLQPVRLLVVGHSVGGQLVGLAENHAKVDALLGVAAQDGYYGHWPTPARYRLAFNWHVAVPVLSRLFGYAPGWLGTVEDLPGGVVREWAQWCRRPTFLFGDSAERRRSYARFDKPLLAYSFEDDDYAPRAAVESLLRFYPNARAEHRHVQPRHVGADAIAHFGFFREKFRNTLWQEAANWLEQQAFDKREVREEAPIQVWEVLSEAV